MYALILFNSTMNASIMLFLRIKIALSFARLEAETKK